VLILDAHQTVAAFQVLMETKAWLDAEDTLRHAATLTRHALTPRLRCLFAFPDDVQACQQQLRVELLHAVRGATALPAADEVTALCAAKLEVCSFLRGGKK
jgi:hypothetical protein